MSGGRKRENSIVAPYIIFVGLACSFITAPHTAGHSGHCRAFNIMAVFLLHDHSGVRLNTSFFNFLSDNNF